ncbi:Hypothetical protein AAM4_0366 [Actinomyces succiniciruminis]|uniref:Uncharacterized protein n=2 Tax=Actinomyces succiniciruminis TaxID=1522002 RepID=A0A1L7R8W3_9ACTO|nr:Hypothetical protein AAM4_0366 [Actinomyces succiniciruminis]
MTRILPPDMELWLTGYLRAALEADGEDVEVDAKEPDELTTPLERPLIIVRDDSGARTESITFDRQVGVSVLAGTRTDDREARRLARLVYAIATDPDVALAAGSPVAAVTGANGPYAVAEDQDVSRRYFTVSYSVVGSW